MTKNFSLNFGDLLAVIDRHGGAYGAAFSVGVLLHLTVFRFGEWNLHTNKLVLAFCGFGITLACVLKASLPAEFADLRSASKTAFSFVTTIVAGIYFSMLIYRTTFHRLNSFPGPFAARLSNFYISFLSIKKFHLYEEVQQLHKKYGDIVRIGPTELSIIDPKAFRLIHAQNTPCVKGPFYHGLHPLVSLNQTRDRADYTQRRKTWDRAFSVKALRDYEPRVATYTDQLLDYVGNNTDKPINMTHWFNFYSFDVMGDLAFGRSFNMLRDGVVHYFMGLVHTNMLLLGAFKHLIWIFAIFKETPLINSQHLRFKKWLGAQVEQRSKNKPDIPDVFSWILEDFDAIPKPTKQEKLNLLGDANLIVVAGSDTTAALLTCMLFELAMNPDICKRLQIEMDDYFAQNYGPEHVSISKQKYLQACIDESLRLHPAVPSGLQRMTPPNGLQVGHIFIPGDTMVSVPSFTVYRDERLFMQPNDFIPERWISRPELVKDDSAFAPFSMGRHSCVGKQLALMEIRYVASQLVHRHDVRLAPGADGNAFLEGFKDGFTLAAPKLELIFTPRKPAKRPLRNQQ